MKRFCVLTTGRAGSTALMDSLATYADIGLPARQYECVDNEVFHPARLRKSIKYYSQKTGQTIRDESALLSAFYQSNEGYAYAGFKTMPLRHRSLKLITESRDIQVVTILRNDLYSTVASFAIAQQHGTWRREGENQSNRLVLNAALKDAISSNIAYLSQSFQLLASCKSAITLRFEDLCSSGYQSAELDAYFGRSIQFLNPRPPVSAESYVENWHEFRAFVEKIWAKVGGSPEALGQ